MTKESNVLLLLILWALHSWSPTSHTQSLCPCFVHHLHWVSLFSVTTLTFSSHDLPAFCSWPSWWYPTEHSFRQAICYPAFSEYVQTISSYISLFVLETKKVITAQISSWSWCWYKKKNVSCVHCMKTSCENLQTSKTVNIIWTFDCSECKFYRGKFSLNGRFPQSVDLHVAVLGCWYFANIVVFIFKVIFCLSSGVLLLYAIFMCSCVCCVFSYFSYVLLVCEMTGKVKTELSLYCLNKLLG